MQDHETPPRDEHSKTPLIEKLRNTDELYIALREETRQVVEQLLNENAGKDFPSLEAKQAFADQVYMRLQRVDLRVECPKEGCHKPAILRASRAGSLKEGVFQFDHSYGTHGGGVTLSPGLKVVNAPPDRRRKHLRTNEKDQF